MSQETTPVSADSDSSNSSSLAPNSNSQFSQAAQAAAQAAQASKASQQASEPIHRYGDRNSSWQAQSDSDNNWGLPVKNLSPQRIAQLNRQAQAEVRLPPFMLFPLSLVVMVCAVCIGVWQAWDLDPNDVDERMELAKFCGTSIEMFASWLSGTMLCSIYVPICTRISLHCSLCRPFGQRFVSLLPWSCSLGSSLSSPRPLTQSLCVASLL